MTFTVRGEEGGESERERRKDFEVSVGKWTDDTRVKQMSKPRLKHIEMEFFVFARSDVSCGESDPFDPQAAVYKKSGGHEGRERNV